MLFNKQQQQGFNEAAQSLKLYRRADLSDSQTGALLIDSLYVDPMPENHILNTILRANTTFLVGRKGTGKSTIFQKLQSELRQTTNKTSAYIDIKTVYESSQIEPTMINKLQQLPGALSSENLEKLLLYNLFLKQIITDIRNELERKINSSIWTKVKDKFTGSSKELFESLDALLEDINEEKFISVLGIRTSESTHKDDNSNNTGAKVSTTLKLSEKPEFSSTGELSIQSNKSNNKEIKFGDILLRTFNIKDVITKLKDILSILKIRHLYVLIDDFSELPEEAMKVVVDALLAPLNNWSDEFIKFKIAAYPGRIYYGNIDKTKIDEIYLDLYKMYGSGDVSRMENSAIDFTKRLIEKRIRHFCKTTPDTFFDINDDTIWHHLFYATMANPRNLGYLLHYLYESNLINQKIVGLRAISEAAERYYIEKIESYFHIGKFLHESFSERSSIFSLKELLESLVKKARDLRSHESEVLKKIRGNPYTSHFHVPIRYEALFSTLELNFFLTKYFEMSDRSGKKVSVFALNYGLCSRYSIRFGRPTGDRTFRLYFVERFFDYTSMINDYLLKNQEIMCDNCSDKFPFESLEALKLYNMQCPKCKIGTVKIVNLSKKYENELRAVDQDLLLPSIEISILQTLSTENTPMKAAEIAGELDCSWQLVGKRGKILHEKGLVKRYFEDNKRFFELSNEAQERYFTEHGEELDIPE